MKKNKKSFSEPKLWQKLNKVARRVGMKVVYPVILLYYLFKSSEIPLHSKSLIVGTLTYFIMPFDGLPDFLPLLGYTDDLSLLIATLSQMKKYVSPEILELTRNKIEFWFKDKEEGLKMEEQIQKQLEAKK
jgi:uncharacterized membrane protein YkvA (DUF1232 family)